jgi:3-oxoacyl-[acyl-carrier-protein] synthase III
MLELAPKRENLAQSKSIRWSIALILATGSRIQARSHEPGSSFPGSIPLALDRAVKEGKTKRGDTLMFAAFRAGVTCGSAMLKY